MLWYGGERVSGFFPLCLQAIGVPTALSIQGNVLLTGGAIGVGRGVCDVRERM